MSLISESMMKRMKSEGTRKVIAEANRIPELKKKNGLIEPIGHVRSIDPETRVADVVIYKDVTQFKETFGEPYKHENCDCLTCKVVSIINEDE